MKIRYTPFIILFLTIIAWLCLLIVVYQKGQEKEALIYANIPDKTIQFINTIIGSIDQHITFDPEPKIEEWDNDNNYEGDDSIELNKLEDEYFIIYYADNIQEEKEKAYTTLSLAHEAIIPLADLMGKYYYPEEVKGRKLPIYLAPTQNNYFDLISKLLNRPRTSQSDNSLGMYICSYSQMGCLTKGIVLSPQIWKDTQSARKTIWHEMNHYIFYTSLDYSKTITPYIWVSEGIAEFFSKQELKLTNNDIIRLKKERINRTFTQHYDNYIGGLSIYHTILQEFGEQKIKEFISHTYSNSMEQVYPKTFNKSEQDFERIWKSYLDMYND